MNNDARRSPMKLFATTSRKRFFAVEILILACLVLVYGMLRYWYVLPNYLHQQKLSELYDASVQLDRLGSLLRREVDSLETSVAPMPFGFNEARIRTLHEPVFGWTNSAPPFETYPHLYGGPDPELEVTRPDLYVLLYESERRGWTLPPDSVLPMYIRQYLPNLYADRSDEEIVQDIQEGLEKVLEASSFIDEWEHRIRTEVELRGQAIDSVRQARVALNYELASKKAERIDPVQVRHEAYRIFLLLLFLVYPARLFIAAVLWAVSTLRHSR